MTDWVEAKRRGEAKEGNQGRSRQLLWKETVEGSVDAGAKRCVHL